MARPRVDRAIGPLARETFQNNEEWLRDTLNTPGLEEFKEHFGAFVPDARDEDQTRAQANAALDWVLAEVAKELAADNTGQGDNLLPDICLKICEYLKGKLAPQQKGGSRKRVALPEAKKDELKLWRAFLRTLLVDQPGMDGACALPLHRVATLLRERGPRVGAALQVTSSFNLSLRPRIQARAGSRLASRRRPLPPPAAFRPLRRQRGSTKQGQRGWRRRSAANAWTSAPRPPGPTRWLRRLSESSRWCVACSYRARPPLLTLPMQARPGDDH